MINKLQTLFIVVLLSLAFTTQAALQMHLTLDNTLNDDSGNGNNGSFAGGSSNPAYATAVLNEGLDFDGNDDYITAGDFDPGSSFTVALWVRPDSSTDIDTYIEHVRSNRRNDFFLGYDNAVGQIFIELEDNDTTEGGACGDPKFCTGIDLSPNRWYHLAVTVTPTSLSLYVDGELAYSVTHSTTVNFNPGTWIIGADSDSNPAASADTDYFDGRLDDIQVYDSALTQSSISGLMSLSGWWRLDQCSLASPGDVIDSSGNGIDGDPENSLGVTAGYICNAGSFDGNNDYIGLPGLPNLTGSFTISAWIRPDAINNDQRIFVDDESNSGGYAFSLGDGGNGRLRFFSRGISPVSLDSSTAISTGSWYYVVAVHDLATKTRQIFVNGSAVTSKSVYTGNWGSDNGTASIGGETDSAGSEATANWRFDGLIDEVKVYQRALTSEEISDYYTIPDPISRTCPSCSGGGSADTIIISTDSSETLGGLSFSDGELAEYDPDTDTATLYFDESLFSGNEDIDAVHVLANGNIILSTQGNATLGGLSFSDGDLVSYDPINDTASLYFDENLFSNNEDIDAVYILDSDNIVLSTEGNATLGGLSFSDGDLVEYDPVADTASLYFDESNFSGGGMGGGADINGVHVLSSGNILISTNASATLGGLSFTDGSIAEYDPAADTATLYFDENLFSGGADINALTIQAASTQLDHYEIDHDGSALTCEAETITLRACADASCSTLYTDDVSVSLSPSGWINGDTQTVSNGTASLQLFYTTAGTVTLAISSASPAPNNATVCLNTADSSSSCDLTFYDTGFVYSIATQTSCATSASITVSAVRLDQVSQTCVPSFSNRSETINFWTTYVSPASGSNVTSLNNGSNDYTLATASPGTGVPLSFDANGEATITVSYPDAGQLSLNSQFDGSGAEAGLSMSGSTSYVTKPAKFYVYSDDANADCASGDSSCTAFVSAGSNFNLKVRAACADNTVTPNFVHNGIDLTHTLIAPAGGSTGTLSVSSSNITSGGTVTISTQAISEVGVFTITAALSGGTDYLGETVIGNSSLNASTNIGRFYPDYFDVSRLQGCNTDGFTYSAQPFTANITAFNTAGTQTQNYTGSFVMSPLISDAGDSSLFSNYNFASGDFTNGYGTRNDVTYTFASKDTAPTIITLRAVDSDAVSSAGASEPTLNIRSGRLNIENAFGSELDDLAIPTTVQYFDGNGYVTNTLDSNCSTISLSLSDPDATDSLTAGNGGSNGQTCIRDDDAESGASNCSAGSVLPGPVAEQFAEPPVAGDFNTWLMAPGASNTGNMDINGSAPVWLQYDWNGGGLTDPSGRASFGLFRGDDRIIYWREQF